jgi:hypothetical protein
LSTRAIGLVTDPTHLVQEYVVQEDCILVGCLGNGALTTDPQGFDCDNFGVVAGVFADLICFMFTNSDQIQLNYPLRAGEKIFYGNGTGQGDCVIFLETLTPVS